MTPAGRPREFDVDEVLDAAMRAFWAHGYEATSMADLMDATGLKKGSIYKAFGSKHELFRSALRRYLDVLGGGLQGILLEAESPAAGLRAWLEMTEGWGEGGALKGCFAVNTVVEMAPHDPEIQELLQEHVTQMTRLVTEVVARGQAIGEFRRDLPPQALARFLTTLAAGVVATARGGFRAPEESSLPDLALAALKE